MSATTGALSERVRRAILGAPRQWARGQCRLCYEEGAITIVVGPCAHELCMVCGLQALRDELAIMGPKFDDVLGPQWAPLSPAWTRTPCLCPFCKVEVEEERRRSERTAGRGQVGTARAARALMR